MTFNRYYQDELAYLRELGAEFTKHNPDLAPYLSAESKDPDVERLIEAFAFLTGRLREQLDDGLPEIVHALLSLLWPQALRPIPCTTTIQFDPIKGAMKGTETVPSGAEILSKTVDGVACRFRTCGPIDVQPFAVTATGIEEISGRGLLRLTITPQSDIPIGNIDLSSLRFFLNFPGDMAIASELRLLLLRHVRSITIATVSGALLKLPLASVQGLGFTRDDAVLQASDTSFDAFRVLQEFLTVPEKFFFLELTNLPPAAEFAGGIFTILFEFERPFQSLTRITPDQIRLNCVSAINAFETEAEPLELSHQLTEYRLLPPDARNVSIVDIVQVAGWVRGHTERVVYEKFESFHHKSGADRRFYYTRLRPSVTRRQYEHYLSFVNYRAQPEAPGTELILARVSCCNGSLPELLGIGDIRLPGQDAPVWANARNVSPVTAFVPPPLDGLRLWSIISIMARNYYPVSQADGLRNLLGHLNFRAFQDQHEMRRQELLLQSIQSVETKPLDALVKGHPIRGRRITMSINEEEAEGLGRAFLFGEVMDHFLTLFANVNSYHRFALRCTRSNAFYTWPARRGLTEPL